MLLRLGFCRCSRPIRIRSALGSRGIRSFGFTCPRAATFQLSFSAFQKRLYAAAGEGSATLSAALDFLAAIVLRAFLGAVIPKLPFQALRSVIQPAPRHFLRRVLDALGQTFRGWPFPLYLFDCASPPAYAAALSSHLSLNLVVIRW